MEPHTAYAHRLEEIGLTKHESVVYLALLSLGTATAYQVAQHCEVKKPTVYITLEDLRLKGLVLKVPHAKKAVFSSRSIGEYLDEQRQRLHAVEAILPQLARLSGESRANVYFFTGIRGIAEAIHYKLDAMRGNTFHSLYGNLAGCPREVMELYAEWDHEALARGISFEILMQKKDSNRYYKATIALAQQEPEELKIKFLEESLFPSNISFEVGKDFVRIIDSKKLYATIVDDAATAEAFHQLFVIAWSKGV